MLGEFPPQAHCHFVVLRAFIEAIQNADVCPANLAILNALCSLYAVFGICAYSVQESLHWSVTGSTPLGHSALVYCSSSPPVEWIPVYTTDGNGTHTPLHTVGCDQVSVCEWVWSL